MKIDLKLLEKMADAGITPQAMVIYLRAQLEPQEARKEKDKLRKRAEVKIGKLRKPKE